MIGQAHQDVQYRPLLFDRFFGHFGVEDFDVGYRCLWFQDRRQQRDQESFVVGMREQQLEHYVLFGVQGRALHGPRLENQGSCHRQRVGSIVEDRERHDPRIGRTQEPIAGRCSFRDR